MSKKVGDYVRQQLAKGYDVSTIKQVMLKYGYSQKDIEDGFRQAYGQTVRHEIHLSKTTIAELTQVKHFIGRATEQTREFLHSEVDPILHKHKDIETFIAQIHL